MYNIYRDKKGGYKNRYTLRRDNKNIQRQAYVHTIHRTQKQVLNKDKWMIHGYRKGVYKDRYTIK